MKKIKILLVIGMVFLMCGCASKISEDAKKFKSEYEGVNGEVREKDGKTIRSINIPEDNPIIYKSDEEIVSMMNNDESFYVYFGFTTCPWCRSTLETLINVAKEKKIDKVYYVNVENIRDKMEVVDGKVTRTLDGTVGYYGLLEKFDSVLKDYTLTVDSKKYDTKEKRIYAPNIVAVKDGVAIKMIEGISDEQTDGYMELTDKMIDDMKSQYNELFDSLK